MNDAPPRPGRPRSSAADRAILSATLELLDKVGFETMSMEGVAARAGVAKTTVYRRWPSKEALVVAAIQQLQSRVAPLVDTGDLRRDLLTLARNLENPEARFLTERVGLRLLTDISTDSALFAALREHFVQGRLEPAAAMVRRAQARGELRADVEPMMLFDLFAGALLFRTEVTRRLMASPPDYAERLMDVLWHGVGCPSAAESRAAD